jgi:nitrate reductase NapE component
MTTSALLFMVLSVAFVTGLCAWCYWKVLTTPPPPE